MSRVATDAIRMTLCFSALVAVILYSFSAELGYLVYNSYDAGRYIALLAPVVPIMYLDHVTDSMLKGMGEQVYSMWVNISDSVLSVLLVWFLIPRLGIMGYALVIVIMEGYNFTLSLLRLRRRLRIRLDIRGAFALPLAFSLIAALLTKSLFLFAGSGAGALLLVLKLTFALSVIVALFALSGCLRRDRHNI
jgi:stage V sporulation protein B